MNAFAVLPEELGGLRSSAFAAKSFTGAKFVKGFNHLVRHPGDRSGRRGGPSGRLSVERRRGRDRSRDEFAKQLGFAPVKLGKLNEGGALVHARGRTWGQLIFQDLFRRSSNRSSTV